MQEGQRRTHPYLKRFAISAASFTAASSSRCFSRRACSFAAAPSAFFRAVAALAA